MEQTHQLQLFGHCVGFYPRKFYSQCTVNPIEKDNAMISWDKSSLVPETYTLDDHLTLTYSEVLVGTYMFHKDLFSLINKTAVGLMVNMKWANYNSVLLFQKQKIVTHFSEFVL